MFKRLLERYKKGDVIVGVIGLGYVGLPLSIAFASNGIKALGFDIDNKKIQKLKKGKSYINTVPDKAVRNCVQNGSFQPAENFDKLKNADAAILCVPTPLTPSREPDLSFVISTAESVKKRLRKGQLVVLESTSYPGTTREIVYPVLAKNGAVLGKDFYMGFSPEREDPGNKNFKIGNIPKIVSGLDKSSLKLVDALYSHIVKTTVPVSSCDAAEAAKLLENIYRAVNIALVNELKILFDKMKINVWEVIQAASTKPFGFQPFYPGPGLGGHCIPIDPFYLTAKAKEYDFPTKFIELAGEINNYVTVYVFNKTINALNKIGIPYPKAKVLVMGVAYKKDVSDTRGAPSLKLIKMFKEKGIKVDYNDPHVPVLANMREFPYKMKSKKLTSSLLHSYDCALILTDHSVYDFEWITANSKLVVDTRYATSAVKKGKSKIVYS